MLSVTQNGTSVLMIILLCNKYYVHTEKENELYLHWIYSSLSNSTSC